MRSKPTSDSDSPWKESLEMLLAQFLGYCLPDVHVAVDWTRPYKSLDKELHQIMPKRHSVDT